MQLEDQVFTEIIKALGAIPEADGELKRRRAPRFHVDSEIAIKPYGAVKPISRLVTLRDISPHGVCLIDRINISAGNQVVAAMPMGNGGTINVLCTVRQSRLTAAGAYRVGAEFTSEMERDTRFVRGVSGMIAAPTTTTSRADAHRADLHQPATMQLLLPYGEKREVKVELRSFAEGQLELLSPEALGTDEQLVVMLQFQLRQQHWRCRVTQTRPADQGQYLISAKIEGSAVIPPAGAGTVRGWFRRTFGG